MIPACVPPSAWCVPMAAKQWLPAKAEGIKVKEGDLLYFNTWGGGGWGDPFQRDPQLVRQDVERRLVTAAGARRYGVVIDADGAVDADSDRCPALRDDGRARRGARGI